MGGGVIPGPNILSSSTTLNNSSFNSSDPNKTKKRIQLGTQSITQQSFLQVWWLYVTLFVRIFFFIIHSLLQLNNHSFIHSFIHSSIHPFIHSFIHLKHSQRPISISSHLQWAEPPMNAETRYELRPALQKASALQFHSTI